MCFRAWLHDVKLELYKKQKESRIVEKHFIMWKKRIDLNSIATEIVRTCSFLTSTHSLEKLESCRVKTDDFQLLYVTMKSPSLEG